MVWHLQERQHVTHSCLTAKDLGLSRGDSILEDDLRILQATHLVSAFVAGFQDELASESTGYSFQLGTATSCYSCGWA